MAGETLATKLVAGEERHNQHIAAIREKAQGETRKVEEVLFINGITADGFKVTLPLFRPPFSCLFLT